MKFTCEKALLQTAISLASRAVSPKSTIPALEGLLLQAQNMLTITGYNLETGIRSICQAEVLSPGAIVLPARLLGELVRKLPDDVVVFSVEGFSVHIACGFADYKLTGLDPEDFPALPEIDGQQSFSLEQRALKSMISQTIFAVSDNESRPIHTGSLFEVDKERLTLVSVDGFRLALRREALLSTEGEFSFVCPGAALSEVEKICRDTEEELSITIGQRHIIFQIGQTLLISRRLEGEFLAWRKAIPRGNPINLRLSTRELLQSIDRVSLIISEKLKSPLRCLCCAGEIQLSTKTALGSANDCCPCTGDGGELEIGFNNRYMMEALRATPNGEVFLQLSSGVSPCVLAPIDAPEGEEPFLYMVLPVRLRAGE